MADMTLRRETAEFDALHDYYDGLTLLADSAIEGESLIPEIPAVAELRVVDGWVVWNGKPVWSPLTGSLTRAQHMRPGTRREAYAAWTAAEHRCLDVSQARLQHDTEWVRHGNDSVEHKARNKAEHGFYTSVLAQLRNGIDHGASVPEIPDVEELQFVDGWLIWNGEPVWWAGEGPAPVPVISPAVGGAFRSSSARADDRPRLRRLLTLPWRRAAA